MFDDVPLQAWLVLLLGFWAWVPAQYIFHYFMASPSRRDITQPQDDLSWRTPEGLLRNSLILTGLAAVAVFIFTPQAEQLAMHPRFIPALIALFASWALFTAGRGFQTGIISPLIKGNFETYERTSQPKRFWASLTWNAFLGLACILAAYATNKDALTTVAESGCFGEEPNASLSSRKEECTKLITRYDLAIRDDPTDGNAIFNRALVHDLLGNRREAIAGYSQAIALDPQNADAYFNRGLIHLDTMDYDAAITDFARVHALEPRNANALANRGMAHAWKGDTDAATRDFAVARTVDPDNQVVMRGGVLLAMNLADFELAVKRANKTLAKYPDDAWTLAQRADAYGRLGDVGKYRADMMRARMIAARQGNY